MATTIRCGFIKPPGSETEWHTRMHGAFEIPHESLGIKHTDQSYHHEVWIHLLHVNARLVDRASGDAQYRRPAIRKRNSPYDHKWNHVAIHARKPSGHPRKKICAHVTRRPRPSACFLLNASLTQKRNSRKDGRVVLRHGRTCSKIR